MPRPGRSTFATPTRFCRTAGYFAHNGVVEGLDVIDERLREVGTDDLVLGDTDSERVFALITASIRARDGDESAGLVDAMPWLTAECSDLCGQRAAEHGHRYVGAARTRSTHQLYVLDRRYDRRSTPPDRDFHMRTNRIRAWSKHLRTRSSVVFASEPMDDDPRWRLLEPGAGPRRRGPAHHQQPGAAGPAHASASPCGPEHARRAGAARVGLNPPCRWPISGWQSGWT